MKIIEFSGMPKSGKTTALEIARYEVRRRGIQTIDYHGGGRYAPIDKAYIAELNLYLAAQAIQFVTQAHSGGHDSSTLALMDRGLFDRVLFTQALLDRGDMSEGEAASLRSLLLTPRLMGSVDHIFVFVTSPELSLRREYCNKLSEREGRIMNQSALAALRSAALYCAKSHAPPGIPLTVIDTELQDGAPQETAQLILSALGFQFEVER